LGTAILDVGCERHVRESSGVQLRGLREHREPPPPAGSGAEPPAASDLHYTVTSGLQQVSVTVHTVKYRSLSLSGQIRDTKPKAGQMDVPGRTVIFFRDTPLKIGTFGKVTIRPGKSGTDGHLIQKTTRVRQELMPQMYTTDDLRQK